MTSAALRALIKAVFAQARAQRARGESDWRAVLLLSSALKQLGVSDAEAAAREGQCNGLWTWSTWSVSTIRFVVGDKLHLRPNARASSEHEVSNQ